MIDYILDIIILSVFVIFTVASYKRGFIKVFIGAFAWLISLVATAFTYKYVSEYFGLSEEYEIFLVFIVMFVAVWILIKLLSSSLSRKVNEMSVVGMANKLGGAAAGLMEAAALNAAVVFGFICFSPETAKTSVILNWLFDFFGKPMNF